MNRFRKNLSIKLYPGKKYPYQLIRDITVEKTGITGVEVFTEYLQLNKNGDLTIKAGYAWDGASGTVNTLDFMLGSLVHDAFYQLMRRGMVLRYLRRKADKLLIKITRANGMSRLKAAVAYGLVRIFGSKYTYPGSV